MNGIVQMPWQPWRHTWRVSSVNRHWSAGWPPHWRSGMNGIELCKRPRESHPHLMKILITAYGSQGLAVAAEDIGITELIEKPITSEAFEASLSRLFTRAG